MYMGKKKLPFNVKTLEKMMTESQKESLKSVLLEKNFRKCDLEHAKSRTTANIEECIMRVKDPFMKKLLKLHEQRYKKK
uniref:Uncharacterized protein n=1 Tax=Pyxicephalus adspersus TaxID=30357 RepID=A0AAV3B3J2_PYXAD|nr:TPA: hypothetical protein GDO54_009527 [Pyxicephalus adspersus]